MPGEANADAVDTQSVAETPDHAGAFPRLDEYQIQELSREGFRRPTEAGEVLYREGDASCDFI
ncbi:MAG: thioredoxin reductase, partial [Actinomycetota bacterium]|nr:thioredoxin reductase [Actinomycetota bacterium]